MAITARAVGAWVASNATTQTVTLPTHVAGDMLILRAVCKPYTAAITCGTAGWTAVAAQVTNGTTANGVGVGSLAYRAFYKIATSAAETNPVVTWGTTSAPGAAVAVSYQRGTTESWVTPVGNGGGDATARTAGTATMATHVAVTAGDVIDFFNFICDDSGALTVPVITQTGVTYSATTEYPATALQDATSNDIGADGGYRTANSGTSSAAAVITWTSPSEQGGAWMTRMRVAAYTLTSVAEVSLASASTPSERTTHSIHIRARVTTNEGRINAALYEGATNRSGDLSSAVTTSLADYTLAIPDASAANITSYANLGVRFWGSGVIATAVEVDQVWLELPTGAAIIMTPFLSPYPQLLAH